MNYRIAQLLAPQDLTNGAGTLPVDIKVTKPISRIEIRFKTTKVLSYMTAPGPANIPKIELVDGSKRLHSLTGYENQALAYYSRGNIAMEHGQHIATLSETDLFAIDFGRFLWDPLLAFDPTKYENPQLQITYDENLADTSVSVNEMEINAYLFDEKMISPIGFLRAIEDYSYTLGASGSYETIKLSQDLPIRQILVRAFQDAYEPWYSIAEARLDENNLDRIPFEFTSLESYYRMMQAHWQMIHTPFIAGVTTSARVFYIPQTDFWASISGLAIASDSGLYTDGASLKGGKASLVSGADRQQVGVARGYLPWHCFQFPMGKLNDPDDWYNPAGKNPRLRLRAYTGATSSTGQVVLEQLQKY